MSFKRNDIVNKQRLRDALEEETAMGFAHNDIVTTYAMDKAIAEGGGGGGETITWILENATATVAYDSYLEDYFAKFTLPDSITADNLISTFAGKQSVTIVDGFKVEAPANAADQDARVFYFATLYGEIREFDMYVPDGLYCAVPATSDDVGETVTLSLGIVEE